MAFIFLPPLRAPLRPSHFIGAGGFLVHFWQVFKVPDRKATFDFYNTIGTIPLRSVPEPNEPKS